MNKVFDFGRAWALEESKRPLAVIVKGNPKYLKNPKVAKLAEAFYDTIKFILEERGYRVTFDAGEPYTSPDEKAAVWVGHSRGIDRLQFAPPGVKTVELQTADHTKTYPNHDARGLDPLHYKLSQQDISALNAL